MEVSASQSLTGRRIWGGPVLPITLCLEMSSVSSQVKKTAAETLCQQAVRGFKSKSPFIYFYIFNGAVFRSFDSCHIKTQSFIANFRIG